MPATYRPIYLLPFRYKVLEKVAAKQLTAHLNKRGLISSFLSGFMRGHSTGTVIVNMVNDVFSFTDRDKGTALVLSDLSAARLTQLTTTSCFPVLKLMPVSKKIMI